MGKGTRESPSALFVRYRQTNRTPSKQVVLATWTSILAVVFSIAWVLVVAFTTNSKNTSTSIWVSRAPVFMSVGAIIMKGSLGSLLSVALYQHLWIRLSADTAPAGISIKQIESHHLASRLAVGMFVAPTLSLGWVIGAFGFAATSAIVPVLQSGIRPVQQTVLVPTSIPIFHAQLDHQLATKSGAAGEPEGATTYAIRAASVALFGEDTAFPYTTANLTGLATFGPVSFVDIECNIFVTPGSVQPTSPNMFYNFTSNFIDHSTKAFEFVYSDLSVNATLNNRTHFLKHTCNVRPARGICTTALISGSGVMKDLRCTRSEWITDVPNEPQGIQAGYMAIAHAFTTVFEGEAWTTRATGRPQQNSTFVAATTQFQDRSEIILPPMLIPHMQRVLWHIPLASKPNSVPLDEKGGWYDLNGTVEMRVQDQRTVLVMEARYPLVLAVVGFTAIVMVLVLTYLFLAENKVLGRLMRDSLVHSLTVSGRYGPAITGACMAGLDDVLEKAGSERLRYGVLIPANINTAGHLGIESVVDANVLMVPQTGMWYGDEDRRGVKIQRLRAHDK